MADKIKFALALVLLAAGVAGFYLLAEQAMILRVLAVLAGVGRCCGRGLADRAGSALLCFCQRSVAETKKVVWPSRKETLQTTGMVFAFVVVMAVFLWLTDKSLEWVFYDLILGWRKS